MSDTQSKYRVRLVDADGNANEFDLVLGTAEFAVLRTDDLNLTLLRQAESGSSNYSIFVHVNLDEAKALAIACLNGRMPNGSITRQMLTLATAVVALSEGRS